jgi:hypothetical protein
VRVTDNVHEDVVEDWQPLKASWRPSRTRSGAAGRAGKPMHFRFWLSENSGNAMVDLEFGYSSGRRSTEAHGTREVKGVVPGRVYMITFPGGWQGRARVDPLLRPGNRRLRERRKRSCAWFHFLPKKTKKKRR